MSLRLVDKIGLAVSLAVGIALEPGAISDDSRSLLITFLGLVSASILPTISLLINSMTANGRSVQAINELESELEAAMDALFFFFGCAVVAVGALIGLTTTAPVWLARVPYLTTEAFPRLGQTLVVVAVSMIVLRAGQIPAILRRSLKIRHDIAIADARRKLEENAPEPGVIRQAFSNHPDFGKEVTLQELQRRESR